MDPKYCSEYEVPLQNVLRYIDLKSEDIKICNSIIKEVIEVNLIPLMKDVDPMFQACYKEIKWSGSTYLNLKIDEPTEFDLNIVIDPKCLRSRIQVKLDDSSYGFVKLKLEDGMEINERNEAVTRTLNRWIGWHGYLQRDAFFRWFIGVMDKALKCYAEHFPDSIYKITPSYKSTGTAYMITIKAEGKRPIDVDLVPVFQFSSDQWPSRPVRQLEDLQFVSCNRRELASRKWYAVPKEAKQELSGIYRDHPCCWRMSFYDHEKDILKGLYFMKPVVKLFKRMRDVKEWYSLVSYYIVTVFLLKYNRDRNSDYWKRTPLGRIFFDMLLVLLDHFEREEIEFFWDERCNMMDNISFDEKLKMKHGLRRIINKLTQKEVNKAHAIFEIFELSALEADVQTPTQLELEPTPRSWGCSVQ